MPLWLIAGVVLILALGILWVVMERNPHHQFIDACGNADEEKLTRLLASPQGLNQSGWFGLTPLGEAIRNGKIANVQLLLNAGALVAAPGARQTHLHTAVQENAVEIARVLLEHGADPSAKSFIGDSPLKIAGEALHVPLFRLLLEYGADPNGDNGVPGIPGDPLIVSLVGMVRKNLGAEALEKLIELVGLLLDQGANINARSKEDAPLIAIAMQHPRMLKLLTDRGAVSDVSWDGVSLQPAIQAILETLDNE